jgi:hypothetical protein
VGGEAAVLGKNNHLLGKEAQELIMGQEEKRAETRL